MNAMAPTAMQEPIGVCRRGFTARSTDDPGSCSSRDMPKQSRIVEAWIARQQTKIAAETTSKYVVANAFEKFASMICAGPKAPLIAEPMFGTAISVAQRKMAPTTKAPTTEARTALGASRRGSLVSSASVDAVSKP